MNQIPHGVIEDNRPKSEKRKDYVHIAGSVMINWQEKPQNTWKRYTQRFQAGSYSCLFQSMAKAMETLTSTVMSASEYFWRSNYPAEGAWLQNLGDIAKNRHFTSEIKSPSQNQSEAQMNQIKPLVTVIGATAYAFPNFKSIDEIAEAIEAYRHCLLTFGSNGDEWQKTPVYLGTPVTFGHCICAIDYTLINGKKVLICEDSSGQWSSSDGLRLITEDFLMKRGTGALYINGIVDYSLPEAPIHHIVQTPTATIDTNGTPSFWQKFLSYLTLWKIPFTVK